MNYIKAALLLLLLNKLYLVDVQPMLKNDEFLNKVREFDQLNTDEKTRSQIEARLLKLLGLKRVPTPAHNARAPAIMQQFYRAHTGKHLPTQDNVLDVDELTNNNNGFSLPSYDIASVSNTVRSLLHIGKSAF